jgi:hypothetical protein
MEASEMLTRSAMHRVGAAGHTQVLQFSVPPAEQRTIRCSCGHMAHYQELRSKPVLTAVGRVEVSRPYYLCAHCHNGQFPADVELDIKNTEFSPGVRRMQATVGQQAAFDHGRKQMKVLAGLEVTTKSVERTAEAIGADIAAGEQRGIAQAVQLDLPVIVGEPIPILYVRMDGTGVPVVKKETEGRQGKTEGQPSHTREVKLGCVFTQTTWDKEGYAIRDSDSTTYTGAIETAEEFGKRIYLEVWNRGWSRAQKKVVMGDGAEWIWNLADQHFPGAVQIVDLYHARQHLWDLARRLHPNDPANQKAWMKIHQKRLLDKGKIDKLALSLRSTESSHADVLEKIRTEADYFERNAQRIPSSVVSTCLSAPVSSKPVARPSSGPASNNPACSGPSAVPTPSSPCDVVTSTAASRTTGRAAVRLNFHFYVAHPERKRPFPDFCLNRYRRCSPK